METKLSITHPDIQFWQENANQIREIATMLKSPYLTDLEEAVLHSIKMNGAVNMFLKRFPRLEPFMKMLVYLHGLEIGAANHDYSLFHTKNGQLIILKAIGIAVEDIIKARKTGKPEKIKFNDYKPIFKGLIRWVKGLQIMIRSTNSPLPDMLSSLMITFKNTIENQHAHVSPVIFNSGWIRRQLDKEGHYKADLETSFLYFEKRAINPFKRQPNLLR